MAVSAFSPVVCSAFRALPAPHRALRACVVVPARDEAVGIAATLDALGAQRSGDGHAARAREFEILLLCNNSLDQTAAIARDWARAHPHIALHIVEKSLHGAQACVGAARQMLMDAAYARLASMAPGPARAICSTDADSRVDAFWLAAIWAELDGGAHAVGGRILVERAPDESPALRRLYLQDTAYRLLAARLEARLVPNDFDPWPRHFQFFGASLALRPEVYAQVGGLPAVNCLEDVALGHALARADVPVRHSPWVRVRTSARRVGRVACGLSTQLAQWETLAPDAWTVATGDELVQRYRLRQRARRLFCPTALVSPGDYAQLAGELFLPTTRVEAAFAESQTFGALWGELWSEAEATSQWQQRWPHVEIGVAIAQLRGALKHGRDK